MSIRILIHGLVQGVFFRHSAKQKAHELGITGWIRNNPDGSVEVLAQGNKKQLQEFIKWCKIGPVAANVEKVEVEWKEVTDKNSDFSITN